MANELTSYFGIVLREKAVVLFYSGSYDGPFSASNVTVKNTMAIYFLWESLRSTLIESLCQGHC